MLELEGSVLRRAVQEQFDPGTFERGRAYYKRRHVSNCEVTPGSESGWQLTATVRGSRPEPYGVTVAILPDPDGTVVFEGECSCPMEFDCKHVVAAILHLANQSSSPSLPFENGNGRLTRQPPGSGQPKARAANPEVQFWLELLARTGKQPVAQPAPVQPDRQLLYVLRPISGRLKIELSVVQLLEKGGYGRAQSCPLQSLLYPQSGLQPPQSGDLRLLRKIALAQSGMHYYEVFLDVEDGAELLQEILATGRCHWRGTGQKHPALRLGAARAAKPVWTVDSQGLQKPSFQIEPPVTDILPLSPAWFVDETTAECGPLETTLPAAAAAAWLMAPAVSPDDVSTVAAGFANAAAALALPKPREIEIVDLPGIKPTPCLRLYSARLKNNYSGYGWMRTADGAADRELSFARVEFDYAGAKAGSDGWLPVLEHYDEGKLRRLRRDKSAENKALRWLKQLGLQPAEEIIFDLNLGSHSSAWTFEEETTWLNFVHIQVPELRQQGWRVELEKSFQFHLVQPDDWFTDAIGEGSGHDWFGIELGVIVGGEKINLLPVLLQMLQGNPILLQAGGLEDMPDNTFFPVPMPDGRKVMFPASRAQQMLGVLLELSQPGALNPDGQLRLPKLRALELAAEADWRWLGSTELREMAGRLRDFTGIKPVPPPENLCATLRPYQQDGLNWLQFLREYGLAGVLADDMGLGKTVQTLAHLLLEKQSGRMDRPSLVVGPTSLMTNWRQEAERFAPDLRVLVLHGLDRKQHFGRITDHDLIITSYPLLPRDHAVLREQEFHCVILDEAQFIKNPKTQYAQIACALKARHHLCLTGTPMENHLGELWSLFHFLLPGFLGDEIRFNSVFRRPIEKGRNEDRRKVLARRITPFILRRKKEEVVKELPPKTEIIQNVELTGAQRDLYESTRLAMHARVKAEINKKGLSRSHIIILDALLKLRQICCHPQLLSLPAAQKVKSSAKLELLLDLLPEMIAEGRRILLFSQFTSMLAIIQEELDTRKIPYVLLTGDTRDRATPVARFQAGEAPLFLISLKAGGTGLNLTAADTVIHYDPWWNPAVENQATDRAHRIGQDKKVFVYKLLTIGTVEEKIAAMQARKRELVESLLNEERREQLKISAEDLDVLFAPLEGT